MRDLARFLLVVTLAGCSPKATEPWAGPTAETGPTEEVAIPSLGVRVTVPAGTDAVHLGAGAT